MTTYNHIPIQEGAAVASSIVNAPLGSLDAAIGNKDELTTAAKTSLVAAINELNNTKQNADIELNALAQLQSDANKLPYFTGQGQAALTNLSAAGRSLIDDASVAEMRNTLELGNAATRNVGTTANDVAAGAHTHSTADINELTPGHQIQQLDSQGNTLTYPDRGKLRFEGQVTVQDDPVNNRTSVILSGGGGGGAGYLNELDDVQLENVTDNHLLIYDSAVRKWVNRSSTPNINQGGLLPPLPANNGEAKFLNGVGTWVDAPKYQNTIRAKAGENLQANQLVYLSITDKRWYKINTTTVPVKLSSIRGIVLYNALEGEEAIVVVEGLVSGFSNLAPHVEVYAAEDGNITQIKPTLTLTGEQKVILCIGKAVSESEILFQRFPVRYLKRQRLAACTDATAMNPVTGGSMTIWHHEDPPEQDRDVEAWLMSFDSSDNREMTQYGFPKPNIQVVASDSDTVQVGYYNNAVWYQIAQSFRTPNLWKPTLETISFTIVSGINNPGPLEIFIVTNSTDVPTTTVMTYKIQYTLQIGKNTIPLNVVLSPDTTYWLLLRPTYYGANNRYWNLKTTSDNQYSNGTLKTNASATQYATPNNWVNTNKDLEFECTFSGIDNTKADVPASLRGHIGETISVSMVSSQGVSLSTNKIAQSFTATREGHLQQFSFSIMSINGSPGAISWQLCANNNGNPGNVLKYGQINGTVGINTVVLSEPLDTYLELNTLYWLVFSVENPNGGSYFFERSAANVYNNGTLKEYVSSWTDLACDIEFSVTIKKIGGNLLAQKFKVLNDGYLSRVLLLMGRFGSPYGYVYVQLVEDANGIPSSNIIATSQYVIPYITGNQDIVQFNFTSTPITKNTSYWLVLSSTMTSSVTPYGSNSLHYWSWIIDWSNSEYSEGQFATWNGVDWQLVNADGLFGVYGPSIIYDEKISVGSWSLKDTKIRCRFDDGTGKNADIATTFKNLYGATLDVTAEVRLP